jgi:16S rRNA (adenine(1408)-N(1))-methyltransferase
MRLVRVVRGREVAEVSGDELTGLLDEYDGLTLDVGTGDGRFAYDYARIHPGRFVIGMDPAPEPLREVSHRALRKPSRGGLANVMFVWSSVEQPPHELQGRASEVFVVLPWAKLMAGLVLAQPDVLGGLLALATPDATLRFVLGADVWTDPVPADLVDLPEVTPEYVDATLSGAYAMQGLRITEARMLSKEEIDALHSTWARRLAHGRERPRFVYLKGGRT